MKVEKKVSSKEEVMVRVLSLWQPWASAVVTPHPTIYGRGVKEFETRHWDTAFREIVIIHATKKRVLTANMLTSIKPVNDALLADMEYLNKKIGMVFPSECLVGMVNIVDSIKSEKFVEKGDNYSKTPVNEYAWGDWSPGRFGIQLSHPVTFPTPIPMKGKQTIFWKLPLLALPNNDQRIILSQPQYQHLL